MPSTSPAGKSFSVAATGSGKGTVYLVGPANMIKRAVEFGHDISIPGEDVTVSGAYQIISCGSDGCASSALLVVPAEPSRLTFFLHPSRVPVSTRNAANATVFVFDRFHNSVLVPTRVTFHISVAAQSSSERSVETTRGIAALEMDSNSSQGKLEVSASLGETTEPRVIQQVASEACHLQMRASPRKGIVTVETDPIRDCAGNALPDGTIVSFTKIDKAGKSTVDAPIKKDMARTQFTLSGPARISVACGIVVGNEVSVGGSL